MLMHPTRAVVIFGNISMEFGVLAIHWHPQKILQRSSQEPVAKYIAFGPMEGYISETVQDRR